MKILHVTPYAGAAWAYGGIPRVVATQTQALQQRGDRVTVLTTDAHDRHSRLAATTAADGDGPEHVLCRNLSNTLAYRLQLFMPMGLGAALDRLLPDQEVAHLHACHNLLDVIAAGKLQRAGVPYVIQPNGTAPRIERRRLAKLAFDTLLGRHVLRDAAAVIAVTETERHQLHGLGIASGRIFVIPNPVDLEEYEQPRDAGAFRSRWGLGDAPMVLYLGQVSPRKRVDLAVRAVAALGETETRLVVAGADMGRGRSVRRLARRLGISHRTLFIGVLPGHQRLEALAAADVVVYPTRDEIFGLVPVEALLCGTPVVVSDDCGCGEVVGQTGGGKVVPYGSVDALRDAIREILANPSEWWAPVEEAGLRARALFGGSYVADRLHALYDTVIAPPPAMSGSMRALR